MPATLPMLALSPTIIATIVLPVLLFLFFFALMVKQYKRCPSNRILVVYGRVGGEQTSRCIHGGGAFVVGCSAFTPEKAPEEASDVAQQATHGVAVDREVL